MGPSGEVTQSWKHYLKEISVVLMRPQFIRHNVRLINEEEEEEEEENVSLTLNLSAFLSLHAIFNISFHL